MKKLSIDLPDDLVRMVRDEVASGRYASADEIIEEALRHLQTTDAERQHDLAYLREKIAESRSDPRPPIPADQVFDQLDAKLRRLDESQGH